MEAEKGIIPSPRGARKHIEYYCCRLSTSVFRAARRGCDDIFIDLFPPRGRTSSNLYARGRGETRFFFLRSNADQREANARSFVSSSSRPNRCRSKERGGRGRRGRSAENIPETKILVRTRRRDANAKHESEREERREEDQQKRHTTKNILRREEKRGNVEQSVSSRSR